MSELPVAIVTGGSRGIGRAISLALARAGHALIVNYVSNNDAADQVVAEIVAGGGMAIACGADVAKSDDRRMLIAASLERFGRLDVLVNNAGITSPSRTDVLEATEDAWDKVFATNLKGPFFLSQLAANQMIALRSQGKIESGKIINMSSVSAFAVSTNRADYCISRAGTGMMTRVFAVRLADESIRVYDIQPGVIETDMTAGVKQKYDAMIAEGRWPIRRWGQPEDVAAAVVALVSDAFPFTTGATIPVDGGLNIQQL